MRIPGGKQIVEICDVTGLEPVLGIRLTQRLASIPG